MCAPPYAAAAFNARIRGKLDFADDDKAPGFTRYVEQFRDARRQALFVEDCNDTGDQVFTVKLPCPPLHPGFCVTDDAQCVDVV
eukprot:2340315-Pyramimonas_sp.AAC.1